MIKKQNTNWVSPVDQKKSVSEIDSPCQVSCLEGLEKNKQFTGTYFTSLVIRSIDLQFV